MVEQNFLKDLIQKFGFTDEQREMILSRFDLKNISKKTKVLKAGEISKEAYYILKGCMRVYYIKNEIEISAYFFLENTFTNACESFIGQKPSRHFIEASEDCQVLAISYENLEKLYAELPESNAFFRKGIEERFEELHHSFTSQIMETAEERYFNLVKSNPDLMRRIPQHQIATYLGMAPGSLSRIRNRTSRKIS